MAKSADAPPPPYEAGSDEQTPLLHPPSYVDTEANPRNEYDRKGGRNCSLSTILLTALSIFSIILLGFSAVYWSESQVALPPESEVPVRIAVVGAGPAGIATAFTLSSLLKSQRIKANITIFEQKSEIGGRMSLSRNLGTGLSAVQGKIHAEDVANGDLLAGNPMLSARAAEYLNLTSNSPPGPPIKVGFFNGTQFITKTTRPASQTPWGEYLSQIYKYGASVWRAKQLPIGTMARFRKMMVLGVQKGKRFEGVGEWIKGAGMEGPVGLSAVDRLVRNGVGGAYVKEVTEGMVKRQYGQGIEEISDLALSAGLEREFGLMGGGPSPTWRLEFVLKKFTDRSKATVRTETGVTGMKRGPGGDGKEEWLLDLKHTGENDREMASEGFDKVILAGPWNTSDLMSVEEKEKQEQVDYRSQWTTFIVSTGNLNTSYFGGQSKLPDQILPIPSSTLPLELQGVHEISHIKKLFGPDIKTESISYLYRISSDHKISNKTVSVFFEEGKVVECVSEKIEYAYPLLYPRTEGFGKFRVARSLWHTSGVEAIGSMVDWSWVTGEVVAGLVVDEVRRERR